MALRSLDVLGGFEVMSMVHCCAFIPVTCNVRSWLANVRPPQVQSEFALIESGSGHRACAQSSSGYPTSDHPSSLNKRMSNPSPSRPAASRPMTKPSSTHSAMTSETRRDLDRCCRQRLRR